ncbi:MAG TPA: FAD:protein FMN transferase [Thermoanaerobaculia bacterium]|nr:FAD:protein FMN transferase [Thermoanaerobaculia bacterium]
MSQRPAHTAPRRGPALARVEDYFVGRFEAMASPCLVLVDCDDRATAAALAQVAAEEALRVERKFSRYRTDNLVHAIHHAAGRPVEVDAETAQLLNYAATCWEVSAGLFDITSGILRRVWKFDGGRRVPSPRAIEECLTHVGWGKVTWTGRTLTLPAGMEIDLGGLGKEYAVDRAAGLLAARTSHAFLVNFGGDLYASGPRRGDRPWGVGIDDPDRTGQAAVHRLEVRRAGLATSGDARRYVEWRGQRLGHILNPKTGWPIADAPRSVTVLAGTCLEAGTLATLAYLQGAGAREFLEAQRVEHWIV